MFENEVSILHGVLHVTVSLGVLECLAKNQKRVLAKRQSLRVKRANKKGGL